MESLGYACVKALALSAWWQGWMVAFRATCWSVTAQHGSEQLCIH